MCPKNKFIIIFKFYNTTGCPLRKKNPLQKFVKTSKFLQPEVAERVRILIRQGTWLIANVGRLGHLIYRPPASSLH